MPTERVVALLSALRGIASNAICTDCGGTWDFVGAPAMLAGVPPGRDFEVSAP